MNGAAMKETPANVVIVDYGLGNLFSVKQACEYAGLNTIITASKKALLSADAVILPGVGAFGDAMASLSRLDLIEPIKEANSSGKLLIGICLGMQLFMTESYEFGHSQGLGLISGQVVRFQQPPGRAGDFRVPQVGWNRIFSKGPGQGSIGSGQKWQGSPLDGIEQGEYMYFVHSYYVQPEDPNLILAEAQYGDTRFCAGIQRQNLFACQFHPERSGPKGLQVYTNIARILAEKT